MVALTPPPPYIWNIKVKALRRQGINDFYSRGGDTVLTFNWVFGPIASKILTQLSQYKRVESNLLAKTRKEKY